MRRRSFRSSGRPLMVLVVTLRRPMLLEASGESCLRRGRAVDSHRQQKEGGDMAKKSASPSPDEGTADPTSARADSSAEPTPKVTRASAAWVAIGVALLLLIFLIVFILQNPSQVEIQFLGMVGNVPLGVALLI